MQGPRGARLHVTYGSMAGEATANLLHVLLWDILVRVSLSRYLGLYPVLYNTVIKTVIGVSVSQ